MATYSIVRNLNTEDILEVINFQKQVYSQDLQENGNVFIQILRVFPDGVFGVFVKDKLAGYLFSHPYFNNHIKPLNSQLNLTGEENCLYLHDMAISPECRGNGLTKQLIKRYLLLAETYGFEFQSLVAVQDTALFWAKFGFKEVLNVNDLGYTNGIYMQRTSKLINH